LKLVSFSKFAAF